MKKLFDLEKPIITSLLETDTYKIRMLYFIWKFFPNLKTQFGFTNRTTGVPLAFALDVQKLREEINYVRTLQFTDAEIDFIRRNENYPEEFLQFLKDLSLSDILIDVSVDGQLIIETDEDVWARTTLWELIVLPIVSELRMRQIVFDSGINEKDLICEGERRLREKMMLLQNEKIRALQFGLRRRASGLWERRATELSSDFSPQVITAVSNMKIAMEQNMPYGGTNAHELTMALNALRWNDGPDAAMQSQYEVFEKWFELYGDPVRIILPDTFGSRQFLDNIPRTLLERASGFRQDSGDPVEFGEWIIEAWKGVGVNPKARTLFFSDGLTAEKMIRLNTIFSDRVSVLFGWGTNFSNDIGIGNSLSIVMKLVRAAGNPAVKLSDNIAKAIGPVDAVARNKVIYGYNVSLNELCVY